MLTFVGEGYTPAFVANLDAIVRRVAAGEVIELVDGPDDVCAPLAATDDDHCTNATVARRDRAALLALVGGDAALDARPLTLDAAALARLRIAFAAGTVRAACRGCEWNDLCTTIAAGGFAQTVLLA
jgi:hypothetical protein